MLSSLVLHVHPTRVRVHALRPAYTLGLGLISFYLFVVLTVTGLALMLYYVPHPDAAYRSMKDIEYAVTFGMFLRNAHRWAAHGMVAVVFLHLCRVFFTGAYKPPREFNWVVGVLLLLLTLALSFTGYLLPWDQLAFWAITVGTSIVAYVPLLGPQVRYLLLGGHEIGAAALLRFYVLHCLILPLAMAFLVALHFWRVRKDGGLSAPRRAAAPPGAGLAAPAVPRAPRPGPGPGGGSRGGAPLRRAPRGDRRRHAHSQPGQGALVLPRAAGARPLRRHLRRRRRSHRHRPGAPRAPVPRHAPAWRRGVVRARATRRERRLRGIAVALVAVTIVGTFFRGPNWAWVWPW